MYLNINARTIFYASLNSVLYRQNKTNNNAHSNGADVCIENDLYANHGQNVITFYVVKTNIYKYV